jgi:hypothetical protein
MSSSIFSEYLCCTALSNSCLNQYLLCVSLCNNFVHDILFVISDPYLIFCHFEFRFRTTSYHHRNIFLIKQMPLLLTYYTYTNFTSFLSLHDSSKYNFVISRRFFCQFFILHLNILKFYFFNYYYFNYFLSFNCFYDCSSFMFLIHIVLHS